MVLTRSAMGCCGLKCVNVVFPDHTHLLFIANLHRNIYIRGTCIVNDANNIKQ